MAKIGESMSVVGHKSMGVVKNGWERVRSQTWVGEGPWSKMGGSGCMVRVDHWSKTGGSRSVVKQ